MGRGRYIAAAVLFGLAAAVLFQISSTWLKERIRGGLVAGISEVLGARVSIGAIERYSIDGRMAVRGIAVRNTNLIPDRHFFTADEISVNIDLLSFLTDGDIIIKSASVSSPLIEVDTGISPAGGPFAGAAPAAKEKPGARLFPAPGNAPGIRIDEFTVDDAHIVWRNYAYASYPVLLDISGCTGTLKSVSVAPDEKRGTGSVRLEGHVGADCPGDFAIGGSFDKRGADTSFAVTARLTGIDLTGFAPYYEITSTPLIKAAKVDMEVRATCTDNDLRSLQDVRMYDIILDDRKIGSEERLFGATAFTVAEFLRKSRPDVKFTFDLNGPLDDIQFRPGPALKPMLNRALGDKMALQVGEIPDRLGEVGEGLLETGESMMKKTGLTE